MKQTVDFSLFCDLFMGSNRGDQFSYGGLRALYDYLTDMEEPGEEFELDIVELCCEYAEYENFAEFKAEYGEDYATIDDIANDTTVLYVLDSDGFIIRVF